MSYQPKTGQPCGCRAGRERDNCARCEGTGMVIDFAAIRARTKPQSLSAIARDWKAANVNPTQLQVTLAEAQALLVADGHAASVEHPSYLCVTIDEDTTFDVGTANGPWEIDVNNGGDIQQSTPPATLPATATARELVDWIELAIENYHEAQRGPVTDDERSNGRASQ